MRARLYRTRKGNGYKLRVEPDDGEEKWLFTSKDFVESVVEGEQDSCLFGEILDDDGTRKEAREKEGGYSSSQARL